MRNSFHFFPILVLNALPGIVSSQSDQLSARPQAIMVVKEDPSTAELVEITMLDPKFPKSELEGIVSRLAKSLQCNLRGFAAYVEKAGPTQNDQFVKSKVGLNNLIDRGTDTVNLEAIARAFAGVPAPYTIQTFRLVLDGELPTVNTVAQYANAGIVVDGQISKNPVGIEYLIALRTQDPAKITIPLKNDPVPAPVQKKQESPQGPNVVLILIVLASISAGALVYFLVASRGGTASREKR